CHRRRIPAALVVDERHRLVGAVLVRRVADHRVLFPPRAGRQRVGWVERQRDPPAATDGFRWVERQRDPPYEFEGSRMGTDIVVVSGLPRSGTSLMMQMLDSGGLEVVTDHLRTADTDNPRGYYEYQRVKKIKEDAAWLPATRGKAFKMVSQLLYD